MQTLRDKKVFFIDTLSADASFVLQHVDQDQIITKREYNNLNHPNHTQEKIITDLLDKVYNKGEESCRRFLQTLQREELQKNFPELKRHFTAAPSNLGSPDHPNSASSQIDEYKMSSRPRGFCVIINNMKFEKHSNRHGSEEDEKSLKEVFTWLGFTPEVHRDQTAQQMKDLLKELSQRCHEGDCFVCCILSHGCADGVCGTDGGVVPSEDIFTPFRGSSCQSLAGKPKVFFIQACRGKCYQLPVEVKTDDLEGGDAEEEEEFEMDAPEMITIPADADFFVARSTVKGFYSIRNERLGSYFIKSLCEQLRKYCPECEEIQSILLCVNSEVSKKVKAKQMPVHKVTLRKKLVFHVPS